MGNEEYGIPEWEEHLYAAPEAKWDPDQAWFWTEEWQAGEREADVQGRYDEGEFYATGGEFLDSLK